MRFAVITGPSQRVARNQVLYAKNRADGLELRMDLLKQIDLNALLQGISLPVMLTPADEKFLSYPFSYVDVPIEKNLFSTVREKLPNATVIASFHDFEKTPTDLEAILRRLLTSNADIFKIACFANSLSDADRMIHFANEKRQEGISVIGICMGKLGVKTRHHSLFDYRAIPYTKKIASGQLLL